MNKLFCFFIFFFLLTSISQLAAQEERNGPTIALTFLVSDDQHSGGLLSVESFLNDHIFFIYSIGAGQSHYFKWEYIINWDTGYRFRFNNGYRPDIRIGFGNLLGYYKGGMRTSKGEILEYDDFETFLTTHLKLGLLNWDLYPKHQIPIRLIANFGIQGQFPVETDIEWHMLFEIGAGYQFK